MSGSDSNKSGNKSGNKSNSESNIESTIDATRKIMAQIKEDASVTLEIPTNVTESNLTNFTPEWEVASKASKLMIDASNVIEIDAAAMQSIKKIVTSLTRQGENESGVTGARVIFDPPPSDAFIACASALGITSELGLD